MTHTTFPLDPSEFQRLLEDGSLIVAFNEAHSMLKRVEEKLAMAESAEDSDQQRQWFTPAEVGQMVGRAEFTVREWCRHGRIEATKNGQRGGTGEWRIHRDEINRYQNEGLI